MTPLPIRPAQAVLFTLWVSLACAERIGPPPAAPAFERPASVIPADLDVAIRIDLARARRLFGPDVARALRLELADPGEDPATDRFVTAALGRADTAWIALRPGLPAPLTDSVVVLRGDWTGLEPPREAGFGSAVDLGAVWRLYERPRAARRSAPTRLYARGDDWLVLVSEAEVDSAERVIEGRARDAHLDPPDEGVASLALRPKVVAGLLHGEFPVVARALDGATELRAVAREGSGVLEVAVDVRYADPRHAERAGERAEALLLVLKESKGMLGRLAAHARADVLGQTLVLRTPVDAATLGSLAGCGEPGDRCGAAR